MACVTRILTRALSLTPATSTLRTVTTRRFATVPRQALQQQARRGYASSASRSSNNGGLVFGGVAAALFVGGAVIYTTKRSFVAIELSSNQSVAEQGKSASAVFLPKIEDYQAVYDAIAQRLIDENEYDDGSYGPVVLRLGWHASGTYDAETGTGGSNGATMRFEPEGEHKANSGLKAARDFLEPIKQQFPWITYSDLWTLAAACAVQEMGGPNIPWRPGRQDRDVAWCTPDGRLPDASKGPKHLRAIFGRMGFDDQEIVALSGAHALGRCHTDRSGFDGPWTFSPITLTNDFFKLLLDEKWHERNWRGPRQFQDDSTKTLMMLPTDMALIEDVTFKPYVEKYARDIDEFFRDFSKALTRLFELGVPFTTGEDARIEFDRTE